MLLNGGCLRYKALGRIIWKRCIMRTHYRALSSIVIYGLLGFSKVRSEIILLLPLLILQTNHILYLDMGVFRFTVQVVRGEN